jgi:predicted PurR-regulated permease PerM
MPRKVEISHRTIIFAVFFLLFLWFLYFIRDILLELFVALLLMAVLGPFVDKLTRIKIPRVISVLIAYLLVFGILGGVIALVIPPLVDQTGSFVTALPNYLSNIGVTKNISQDLVNEFLVRLGSLPGEIIKITFSLFSNVISVLTVLVFAFYMLLARGNFDNSLGLFFGDEKKKEVGSIIEELESRLGGWARGELFLMFSVGLATFIGLTLMGVPFAIPLSILAGVLEIIPYVGPVVAAVPSMIIGFGISPLTGFGVMAMAFLIQQVENYVLVPKIMEKSVGVSPIVVLVALAIGARMAGVTGMIISVPSVIALQIFLKRYLVKE